jgi:hypothetical protein
MDEEITSIEKNDTLKLVPRPSEKKPIPVKWIIKEKKNAKKKVERWISNLFSFLRLMNPTTHIHTLALVFMFNYLPDCCCCFFFIVKNNI